jgi:hypothetical protein
MTAPWRRGALATALRLLGALAAVGLGASAPGCISSEPVAVIVTSSTLVVDWSIESRTNPADCASSGAESIQLRVVESSGRDAGTFEQACSVFTTSLVLAPGTYSASAVLLDVAGQPRTTTVLIAPFTLFGGEVFDTPVDFPAVSFF